jgi:hypothetical protein
MGLFRRRPKPDAGFGKAQGPDAGFGKAQGPDASGTRTVHERIEVTVEREWISMVVRNPAAAQTVDEASAAEAATEAEIKAERALKGPDLEPLQAE